MDSILIVFNIPESLGSSDLRRFFTDFVEHEKFVCFHYKRRPESKLLNFDKIQILGDASSSPTKFNCCPLKINESFSEDFIRRYNDTHWTDEEGVDLNFKCFITRGSLKDHWQSLEESNPPSVLPEGNVGTCTKFLLDSIQSCKLPPSVIKRLKLNFHERRRRAYATVPLSYNIPKPKKSYYVPSIKAVSSNPSSVIEKSKNLKESETFKNVSGNNEREVTRESLQSEKSSSLKDTDILSHDPQPSTNSSSATASSVTAGSSTASSSTASSSTDGSATTSSATSSSSKKTKVHFEDEIESVTDESGSDESSGEEEEWDRHRTLHNDVSARRVISNPEDLEYQEGTKERRYEENMEVTWDKGSSGLVFYTDEQFWRENGQDDSDEPDDWDVDMEGYEVEGGGDIDNRDFMDMHRNTALESGKKVQSVFKKKKVKTSSGPIGDFEKHTLGVGRKLMEKQGWKDGDGLGSKLAGISRPVSARGTSDRAGLGYKGSPHFYPKARTVNYDESIKKREKKFHISTVYDPPEDD